MNSQTPIPEVFRLLNPQKTALKKLGLETINDLLHHFPAGYGKQVSSKTIRELKKGDEVAIYGIARNFKLGKAFRKRMSMAECFIEDQSGRIKSVWFNQPYLAKMISEGSPVRVVGKVSERKGELYLANPEIESLAGLPSGSSNSLFKDSAQAGLYPKYPESRGITSRWFYHAIQKVLKTSIIENLSDPIPKEILAKYHLPDLKTSLIWIHMPKKEGDGVAARKRFAFEEIFFIQLQKMKERKEYQKKKSFLIEKSSSEIDDFIKRFPFQATDAQKRAIESILKDFKSGQPMSRLLEGDVGSGKTAVAAVTTYATVTTRPSSKDYGNLQVAYMAPTEILATQHFESFIQYFKHLPINIALITGSGCRKFPSKVNPSGWTNISRAQLLKWVSNGEIAVLIGTHALIQKTIKFKDLAYIIIDEQHRFGVRQRQALARGKNAEPTPKSAEKIETLIYKDLTYTIRGILFEIKKTIGLGHKELVYQNAFEEELKRRKLPYNKERQIAIMYRGKKIGVYQPDFVIDEKIIVEFKSILFLGQKEKKQLWTYLKGSEYNLALLVNIGGAKLEIQRVIYDMARNPKTSASDQQSSASIPHLLSMTATPIPRTLALTIYGDLDLSLIDEMPKGRKKVITEIVPVEKRKSVYEKIRAELKSGRQIYVICPRIEEPDPTKEMALEVKSVKAEAERLQKEIFPEYKIDILHSKMKPADKDATMLEFKNKEIDILVATSVVEVGVNVENATNIIIEGAERFGLSQLHQLRGRVIRSNYQPYCYIFSDAKGGKSADRFKALVTAKNGFELSEQDLLLRGAGELYGRKQWGITDVGMEAVKNIKMVEAARSEARELVEEDETLEKYPILKETLKKRENALHFE